MQSRLRNIVALLLAAVMTANTIFVGAAHVQCHHATVIHQMEDGYRCAHGHEHHPHTRHDDQPIPSPTEDDCAACRFLAQSASPDVIETEFAAVEVVANALPIMEASPDVPPLLSHHSRAPPELPVHI